MSMYLHVAQQFKASPACVICDVISNFLYLVDTSLAVHVHIREISTFCKVVSQDILFLKNFNVILFFKNTAAEMIIFIWT